MTCVYGNGNGGHQADLETNETPELYPYIQP